MENNNQVFTNPVDYTTPNSIAAIWSMMLPGLGQLMKRQVIPGIFWAFFVAAGYFAYLLPGLILHALCILDAAFYKGNGSFIELNTWPKRIGFLAMVGCLLTYIYFRNGF